MNRKDLLAVFLLVLILTGVFWPLVTLEKGFLSGDHREQQYPWAKTLQQEIHEGRFPWWTPDLQCGFPLLAEGQIGAFYPLNLAFFYLLPTKVAYNYGILFHYVLGALLFYAFLRRLNLGPPACFFATLIYLFGSAQGGYFYYNYISQKVVIWLPLSLLLTSRILEFRRWPDAFWLAVVFAVEVFGGYLQVAVYTVFFTCFYFLYFWIPKRNPKALGLFALAGLLGIFFSLVQLLPTYELSLLSSRADAVHGIAYLGSMTPAGWVTLFYPAWDGFLGSELYAGVLGLFFVFAAFAYPQNTHRNFFAWAAVFFLLLALGRFSPLYTAIIELTGFNSFRTPIKFLFFVSFSLAALAAYGFEAVLGQSAEEKKRPRKTDSIFLALGVLMLAVPPLAELVLRAGENRLLPLLRSMTEKYVYGKPGHPYALDFYRAKAEAFYHGIQETVSLQTAATRIEWAVLLASLVVIIFLTRFPVIRRKWGALICTVVLFADLFLYGFTSIRPGFEPLATMDAPLQSPVLMPVTSDPGLFRVMDVYEGPTQGRMSPLLPSMNMLYNVPQAGIYSPLAVKGYRDFTAGWIYVNDSLSVNWVHASKVLSELPRLSALNVKYLFSRSSLESPQLILRGQEDGLKLYENTKVLPRALFYAGEMPADLASLEAQPHQEVRIDSYESQRVKLSVTAPSAGTLFLSDLYYSGWKAEVDGKETAIARASGLFRSLRLEAGEHRVTMEYRPLRYQVLGLAAFAVFIAGLPAALIAGRRP